MNKRIKKMPKISKYITIACKEQKISVTDLSKKMFISPQALYKKIRLGHFTYEDLKIIFSVLKPTNEELRELFV